MQKILTIILLVVFSAIGYSQNITLKGKIKDPEGLNLEAATVYLSKVKDSTLVEYTITDSKGGWELKTRSFNEPVVLKVSFIGFKTYQKQYETLTADTDFGEIKLEEQGTNLKEVVIEGDIPPVRIKKDTLEFDAASFKVRPDSNVQTLLKQLPGVDIDADGKITVNGKEVNQILVNGKPFFDKDGKIALQSLPADIIKKVQVSDTKTKKEELSGQRASGDNSSINLTIDEKNNKGFFGKITGGYGTDDRYEANALINHFKGKRKISLLASSNNINSTGFSNDDIFDSMGGGRNLQFWNSGDGGAYINGQRVGGGSGITTTNIVGINYLDEWAKGLDPSINWFYTDTSNKNNSRSRNVTYLPGENGTPGVNSIIDETSNRSTSLNFSNNINTQFEIKLDSTSRIFFAPKFSRTNSKTTNYSQRTSLNQDDELLNESDGLTLNDRNNTTFSSALNYSKVFDKKGRSLDIELNNNNNASDGFNLNNSQTRFYEDLDGDGVYDTRDDNRNQIQRSRMSNDNYYGDISYTQPVTDSLEVTLGSYYSYDNNVENLRGFDYNDITGEYTSVNDSITSYQQTSTGEFNPYAAIHLKKKKIDVRANLGTSIYKFDNYGEYLGEKYSLNKKYILPSANANAHYNFERGKSLSLNYSFNVSLPSAAQVLPIIDVSSALSTITGNPDLDPSKNHNVNLSFRNYDWASRSGYFVWAYVSIKEMQIATNTVIRTDGKRETTYENISGGYNGGANVNYSKSKKSEAGNTFRYSLSMGGNYSLSYGYTNGALYSAKNLGITPGVNLTYELGEMLTINPSYNYTFNNAQFENLNRDATSNFVHRASLQITNYWPKHFVIGNDFTYTYNSQISAGYKKDFLLWNTSVGYNFMKDKMLFKVKIYDILNQNLGTGRSITSTGTYDYENTVLKRYMMFSLTYKINNFGDNSKRRRGGMRMF